MRIITIIKIILFGSALTGITSLIWVLPQYDLANPSEETFYALHYDHPVQIYLAAIGIALLFALLIWSFAYRPPHKLYRRFQQIDSNMLDSDANLCRNFYQCALAYRIQKGAKNFQRYFIQHYNFFYEFHNYALSWINEILASLPGNRVPQDFILSAICTGHIGQIFTAAHYADGLAVTGLEAGDPLLFHARANEIEIWSYDMPRPLCKIKKRTIKLQHAHRHANYLTAIFTGTDQAEQTQHHIELRFLTLDHQSGRSSQKTARQRISAFKQWLRDSAKSTVRSANDYGIDVSELLSPDWGYEAPLTHSLKQLEGKQIQAFFTRTTLPIHDKNVPLDAVVLCNGIGIVTISEQPQNGNIIYSGDPVWQQHIGDDVHEMMNPCLHAQLARSALSIHLSAHHLTRWPVTSLVVFSSSNATINMHIGKQRPQCHVLKLENLDKWFAVHHQNDTIQFSDNDLISFRSALSGQSVAEPSLQFATV